MALIAKEITDKPGKEEWFRLPWKIYRKDPLWVPPLMSELRRTLDPSRNPYFRQADLHLFAAYRDGIPVARTAVLIHRNDPGNQRKRPAIFGFFESEKDPDACKVLFGKVERQCLSRGIDSLEGPFNPNHYSELGMLSDNFTDPPAFFETYNPAYYNTLLEENGFRVSKKLHTRINRNIGAYVSEKFDLSKAPLRKEGFRIRTFKLMKYASELENIRQVNNDAFSENWHFLPLSGEEYRFAGKYMFLVTRPRLVLVVEHQGQAVGVLQCVLNVNRIMPSRNGINGAIERLDYVFKRRKLKELVIFSIGIKKTYHSSPVYVLLLQHFSRILKDYSVLSTTWMTDSNMAAIRAAERLGLQAYKWFNIYEKTF